MQLEPRLDRAMRAGAELVKERAQARVRVATGRLHDAIHVERTAEGYMVIAGNDQVFYGHIVEHGGNRPPHPFLIPAEEESRDDVGALGFGALKGL